MQKRRRRHYKKRSVSEGSGSGGGIPALFYMFWIWVICGLVLKYCVVRSGGAGGAEPLRSKMLPGLGFQSGAATLHDIGFPTQKRWSSGAQEAVRTSLCTDVRAKTAIFCLISVWNCCFRSPFLNPANGPDIKHYSIYTNMHAVRLGSGPIFAILLVRFWPKSMVRFWPKVSLPIFMFFQAVCCVVS